MWPKVQRIIIGFVLAVVCYELGDKTGFFNRFYLFAKVVWFFLWLLKPTISLDIRDIEILMWTTNASQQTRFRSTDNFSHYLANYGFNGSNPTKFLVHGFSDAATSNWIHDIKNKYMTRMACNVFSIDWEKLSTPPYLTTTAKNTRLTARVINDLIRVMISEMGSTYKDFHLIGISIGAQAVGYAGYLSGGRIGRITGLDPCGGTFHIVPHRDRLDRTDAKFVDVYHTAGRWIGNDDVIGHVDFYANNGKSPQPGCTGESLDLMCSHFRSWEYFSETIPLGAPTSFARRCRSIWDFHSGECCRSERPDVTVVGDPANRSARGTFFFHTDRKKPFTLKKKKAIQCRMPDIT